MWLLLSHFSLRIVSLSLKNNMIKLLVNSSVFVAQWNMEYNQPRNFNFD